MKPRKPPKGMGERRVTLSVDITYDPGITNPAKLADDLTREIRLRLCFPLDLNIAGLNALLDFHVTKDHHEG